MQHLRGKLQDPSSDSKTVLILQRSRWVGTNRISVPPRSSWFETLRISLLSWDRCEFHSYVWLDCGISHRATEPHRMLFFDFSHHNYNKAHSVVRSGSDGSPLGNISYLAVMRGRRSSIQVAPMSWENLGSFQIIWLCARGRGQKGAWLNLIPNVRRRGWRMWRRSLLFWLFRLWNGGWNH